MRCADRGRRPPRGRDTVLDLGSGAGADVLISARRVGPSGRVVGLDMTDEMLELARRNAEQAGVGNVEFRKGYIEDIPLPDDSIDVVISNCVLNLSGDKPRVIREAAQGPAAGRTFRDLGRGRRRGHGRGDPRRHAQVDRLHRRCAHPPRVRGRARRGWTCRDRDPRDPPRPRARRAPRSSAPASRGDGGRRTPKSSSTTPRRSTGAGRNRSGRRSRSTSPRTSATGGR